MWFNAVFFWPALQLQRWTTFNIYVPGITVLSAMALCGTVLIANVWLLPAEYALFSHCETLLFGHCMTHLSANVFLSSTQGNFILEGVEFFDSCYRTL